MLLSRRCEVEEDCALYRVQELVQLCGILKMSSQGCLEEVFDPLQRLVFLKAGRGMQCGRGEG